MAGELDSKWLVEMVMQFMQSPSFNDPLQSFVDENCGCFDDFEEENKLEYQELHNEFKNLVDSLLAAHLLEVDVSPEQFEQTILQAGLVDDPAVSSVLSKLLAAEDFIIFKGLMVDCHAAKQRQAEQMLQDTSGDLAAAQALQAAEHMEAAEAFESSEEPPPPQVNPVQLRPGGQVPHAVQVSQAALRRQVDQASAPSSAVLPIAPSAAEERRFNAGGGSYGRAIQPTRKPAKAPDSKAALIRGALVSSVRPG